MKRTSLIVASLLLAFTGCSCGQSLSSWRPNIFGRLHDRIHGTNVGAPCMSGGCASAPSMAAPAMASVGCETCGNGVHSLGYEGYASDSYGGETVIGSYDNVVNGGTSYGTSEVVPPSRVQPAR